MGFLFIGYLVLYPLMQGWTLARCRGGWRIASLVGLVPMAPFYLWSLYKVFGPKESGDLSGLLILLFAPASLLYLGLVASGGAKSRA